MSDAVQDVNLSSRRGLTWGQRLWLGGLGLCLGLGELGLSWYLYRLRGQADAWLGVGAIAACGLAGLALSCRVMRKGWSWLARYLVSALVLVIALAASAAIGGLFLYHWHVLQWS